MKTAEVADEIREHLGRFWPDNAHEGFVWTLGPVKTELPNLRVVRIKPRTHDEAWTYVTVGNFEQESRDERLEFFLLAPYEEALHIELLALISYRHAQSRYRVQQGSIVDIGRPWVEGSACSWLYVSLPYTLGPNFDRLQSSLGLIRFLWLVPITPEEARYGLSAGAAALEDRLEESDLNFSDPQRPSSVASTS